MQTITVSGASTVACPPDQITVSLTLNTRDEDYDAAVAGDDRGVAALGRELPFTRDQLKTSNYLIHSEYDYEQQEGQQPLRVFRGYLVQHQLALEFELDLALLAQVLEGIGRAEVEGEKPEVQIGFGVQDAEPWRQQALAEATEQAKQRALVLCAASSATLGELQSIRYADEPLQLRSATQFSLPEQGQQARALMADVRPQDVQIREQVTFVWRLHMA